MIDPNKTYRTRDGRAVRIYATDGTHPWEVHGAIKLTKGWEAIRWGRHGEYFIEREHRSDLVEVNLADELRDQIPWEALRPEWRYASMNPNGDWWLWNECPIRPSHIREWELSKISGSTGKLAEHLNMPDAPRDRWEETLIERPEGR